VSAKEQERLCKVLREYGTGQGQGLSTQTPPSSLSCSQLMGQIGRAHVQVNCSVNYISILCSGVYIYNTLVSVFTEVFPCICLQLNFTSKGMEEKLEECIELAIKNQKRPPSPYTMAIRTIIPAVILNIVIFIFIGIGFFLHSTTYV
jgi:hypothetical protein